MTTTEPTPTRVCEETGCDAAATTVVHARYYDPDPADDDGRPLGWSRVITQDLCDEHVAEQDEADDVIIHETESI